MFLSENYLQWLMDLDITELLNPLFNIITWLLEGISNFFDAIIWFLDLIVTTFVNVGVYITAFNPYAVSIFGAIPTIYVSLIVIMLITSIIIIFLRRFI